jgi:hypothetical protein
MVAGRQNQRPDPCRMEDRSQRAFNIARFSQDRRNHRSRIWNAQGRQTGFQLATRPPRRPEQASWVTFQDNCLWWCTVRDGAVVNPNGESPDKGNFWLVCDRPWSNCSIKGTRLAIADLPGTVTKTAGFHNLRLVPTAAVPHRVFDPIGLASASAAEWGPTPSGSGSGPLSHRVVETGPAVSAVYTCRAEGLDYRQSPESTKAAQ